ncbi:hypothetical protein [Streptomyces sp. NBC_01497]|uniref:hypothetical protein n=1 Tax=Streptomyces sp. NBC_01497 TaxID=2903885 RepID=UPI002E33E614|nr:hypothetical protein [Streptomyces sp. NBC_01497]
MSNGSGTLQRYAEQVTTDLQANRDEQTALQHRLAQLVRDEGVLVKMQASLNEEPPHSPTRAMPTDSVARSGEASTASPRKKRAATLPVQQGTTKADVESTPNDAPSKVKRSGPSAVKKATAPGMSPTLAQLVYSLLLQHTEPRTAGEVTAEVNEVYPDRKPSSPPLVRQALNRLVAQAKAERLVQGSSVMYTAVPTGETSLTGVSETRSPAQS